MLQMISMKSIGLWMVVIGLGVALAMGACGGTASFYGTELDPPQSAADFSLQSHQGDTFRMADQRGKVVVLTFLYTSCTDVCPFVGVKLKRATEELGDDADRVAVVAVSTDPERDSLERVRRYSQSLGMNGKWDYLIGSMEQLEQVWGDYYVAAPLVEETGEESVSKELLREYGLFKGLDMELIEEAMEVLEDFGGGYDVQHSTPIWLIDPQGRLRVKLGMDVGPLELVHDIRLLLK